jgi:hypothetical protein
METNNALNLKSSGIVSYDGAGTFSALFNPLTIANGGSGVASNTAYATLTGGTTSTNPIQSIASVGTAAQSLTSNGASALPTFVDPVGYTYELITLPGNPADSQTYVLTNGITSITTTVTTFASGRFTVPKAGTVTAVYGVATCTVGSAENSTIKFTLNGSADTNITTTLALNASPATFNNTGLAIAVVAGDYLQIKWVTPAWVTNPTSVRLSITVYIQ